MPASEEAQAVHRRMSPGEVAWVRVMRIRDPVSHRRYWALMTLCAQNCERIELPSGGVLLVHNKNDVHTAVKLCTGHCDTIFDAEGRPVAHIPKSTDFGSMTKDEWNAYWPRVLDVVQQTIIPGVEIPEVQDEIMKCMGWAA